MDRNSIPIPGPRYQITDVAMVMPSFFSILLINNTITLLNKLVAFRIILFNSVIMRLTPPRRKLCQRTSLRLFHGRVICWCTSKHFGNQQKSFSALAYHESLLLFIFHLLQKCIGYDRKWKYFFFLPGWPSTPASGVKMECIFPPFKD